MTGLTFANSERRDPYKNFRFTAEFVGKTKIIKSGWSAITGVDWRTDFTEYREGGNNGVAVQIPKEPRFEPVVMKRGMSETFDILKTIEFSHSKDGIGITSDAFFDVIIKVYDRTGNRPVRTIFLRNAWISAYKMSDLDAMTSEVIIDQITIMHNGVDY